MSKPFGCIRNTIRVRSGSYLDLLDPKPEQFTIEDIAGALSKICRFGGQIPGYLIYSVAEHSLNCYWQACLDGLSVEVQRAALLHDATEAFLGDVVKPLKVMLEAYQVAEKRMEKVIADKYGVDFSHPAIKEIDHAMLIAERKAIYHNDNVEWAGQNEVRVIHPTLCYMWPESAEKYFMSKVEFLNIKD